MVIVMAVSKGGVPMLDEEASRSFIKQLKESRIQKYSDEERRKTDARIMQILIEKKRSTSN